MGVLNHGNTLAWNAPGPDVFAHIKQLDSLRAFAVGSVMLGHYFPGLHSYGEWGSIGVNLFFVISGFLITGILLKCRKQIENGQSVILTLRQFYVRRFLRIFPLYYMVIFLAAIVNFSDVRRNFLWYVTYTVNYYGLITNKGIGLPHFWTLALEEQFYLMWPILILLVPRRGLVLVPLAAILIAVITRTIIVVFHLNWMSLMLTPVSLDTLGFGALLAVCSDLPFNRVTSLLEKAGIWVGLPLLIALKITGNFGVLRGLGIIIFNTAIGLFSVWMIIRTVKRVKGIMGWILERRSLRYLGTVSYGEYVYHLPVLLVVFSRRLGGIMPHSPLLKVIVCGSLTVVIASLSWFLFERPINGLKRWFPYRLTEHHQCKLAVST